MPGCVGENGYHHRKADKERTSRSQAERHDYAPRRHGRGIGDNCTDGGLQRDHRADVAIDQQRERDDADGQRDSGKQGAERVPTMISTQPLVVVKISFRNCEMESGGSEPNSPS